MEREKKRVKEKLEREKKKDEVAQEKAAEKLRQLQIREAKKAAERAEKGKRAEERKRLQDEKRRWDCVQCSSHIVLSCALLHHDSSYPLCYPGQSLTRSHDPSAGPQTPSRPSQCQASVRLALQCHPCLSSRSTFPVHLISQLSCSFPPPFMVITMMSC